MGRIVKEPAVRRDEILDAAQRLISAKGYERMTIRDIIDDLQISNGAFYHYFASKHALLTALMERTAEAMAQLLIPISDDPGLSALEKLNSCFAALRRFKSDRRVLMHELSRQQYADENALVRQKAFTTLVRRASPLLAHIIRQGVGEGVFTATHPDEAGGVLLSLSQNLKDAIADLVPSFTPEPDALPVLVRTIAAYTEAMERALGAPAGSVSVVDPESLGKWIANAQGEAKPV